MTSSPDFLRVVAEYVYEDVICKESVMDCRRVIGQTGDVYMIKQLHCFSFRLEQMSK